MRTLIMLGIAASAVVAAERAAAAEVPLANGVSLSDTLVAAGHKKKKDASLEYGVGYPGDSRVYSGGADRYPVEGEYRRVEDGDYQGRWTGTWDGTYEAPDGRVYEGQYRGTYEGERGTSYAPAPHGGGYRPGAQTGAGPAYAFDAREDARMARICGEQGLGGAAIGAVAGGIAGNRIAGRGNRLGGTLIGAGVGGIIGNVIDRAEDRERCNAWRSWRSSQSHSQHGGTYYPGGYPAPAPYPYPGAPNVTTYHQGGYGYYSPGVIVTTIITPAAPVTETVTTTTTRYETVYVNRARHAPKKRVHKPRPKPRCVC